MAITLSFISTLSFLPRVSLQSSCNSISNRYFGGTIHCQKTDVSTPEGAGISRREALKCFAGVLGMELVVSSGSFTEEASAADLIQRRQRSEFLSNVKEILSTAIKDQPELIPFLLTLALNDAITFEKKTKTGGPNGSIRLSLELSRLENKGLSDALNLLQKAKLKIDSDSRGGQFHTQISSSLLHKQQLKTHSLLQQFASVVGMKRNGDYCILHMVQTGSGVCLTNNVVVLMLKSLIQRGGFHNGIKHQFRK